MSQRPYAAPPGPWRASRPAVVGHRGARGLIPENTIASVRAAIDAGCSGVELDVRLSADGHVIVWHDATLDPLKCRSTDVDYSGARVDDLTLAQLRTVDVGSPLSPRFPRQRPAHDERIVTLGQLFAACAQATDVWWIVEVKVDPTDPREVSTRHTLVDRVLASIAEAGVQRRSFVHSFDWTVLELARQLDPERPRSALAVVGDTFAPASPWLGRVKWEDHRGDLASAASELEVAVISPDVPSCDIELVSRAHALNLAVVPWTVNDPAEIRRLVKADVDGIVTDDPDLVLDVVRGEFPG
ncbi:MAG: glycerophosphodiester phosphodiesterase [Actinomycetales bacterium]|nr:glycerophosphodiester phosphodiesterase [Candidatus Phosphoribacter baldrii]